MNVWRPYTQMGQGLDFRSVQKTKDSYIYLQDGKKLFDGISSWWVITHGHCNPQIVEAIGRQTEKVDQVVFANFDHESAEMLVEELKEVLPTELDTVFFSDNGSTAVEVAMKMAFQYCQQTGNTSKQKFCAFASSFHGDTCGAMSVTGEGPFVKPYHPLRFEVLRCDQGSRSCDPSDKWTYDFELKLREEHKGIAAVIIEPLIQGAGGMIMWPLESLKKISDLCRELNVLLIFDEVMTGFGRTGTLFAFEQLDEVPDFVCMSKGLTGGALPLAITLTQSKIYEAFVSKDTSKMFFHGHSFTANAISCAAAAANLRIFKQDSVYAKIAEIERAHVRSLAKLQQKVNVRDARVRGVVGAIELMEEFNYGSSRSRRIFSKCFESGLFLRPLGNVIYLMPPYCSTSEEVEWAWDIIAGAIEP